MKPIKYVCLVFLSISGMIANAQDRETGVELSPIAPAPKRTTVKPKRTSPAQCVQLAKNQWVPVECPQNVDCGETDPSKYPWVVLTYKNGKYDGMNDYKAKEYAEQQMKFWEHFNNVSWPKFAGSEPGLYNYEGPFRKCRTPLPQLTNNRIASIVMPYLNAWKSKFREAYMIIYRDRDLASRSAFREYIKGLKNAERSARRLENLLNNYTDGSLDYIKESIGNLYDAGLQMNEAKIFFYSALPGAPPDFHAPGIGKEEIDKRRIGLYELGNKHVLRFKSGGAFKLTRIHVSNNTTTLYFEGTGGRVNKGNVNEFFIVDKEHYRYALSSVHGITANVIYNRPIQFSCVFRGRLNNVAGPFHLIEGQNAPLNEASSGGAWWNIYNITLD